jgi:hypothetical protein
LCPVVQFWISGFLALKHCGFVINHDGRLPGLCFFTQSCQVCTSSLMCTCVLHLDRDPCGLTAITVRDDYLHWEKSQILINHYKAIDKGDVSHYKLPRASCGPIIVHVQPIFPAEMCRLRKKELPITRDCLHMVNGRTHMLCSLQQYNCIISEN